MNSDLYKCAELSEREKRYLRHLTREASTVDAEAVVHTPTVHYRTVD